jgi:hypothetical protein
MQTVRVQVVSVCGFPEAVSSLPEPGLDEAEAETAEKEKDGGVARDALQDNTCIGSE